MQTIVQVIGYFFTVLSRSDAENQPR